ncbi:helix-turn-helix domain-containing protein [soil metagenome]
MKQEVTKRLLVKRATEKHHIYQCSVIGTLKVFATKWKPCILCYLGEKTMHYNELYRIIPNISRKMLSEHLRELETDQLIQRIQYDHKLQRVEYSLTEKERSLMPIFDTLQDWGMDHIKGSLSIREMLDVTMA